MNKKEVGKKEYDRPRIELLEAFETYRRSTVGLARMRSKHRALLASIASASASRGGDVEELLNRELDRQYKELVAYKKTQDETYGLWREKLRNTRQQVADPFSHKSYEKYPYAVGSYMLLTPDQCAPPPEDLSGCAGGRYEKQFWKIGLWDLTDDRILADPPTPGVRITTCSFPLTVRESTATPPPPWMDTYYAVDGPVSRELRIGAKGANGSAFYGIKYGIDIAQWGGCGIEILAESEVSGIVDVGGYPDFGAAKVEFRQNIHVVQYRGLGASISEVDLWTAPVYRSWHAFPPASFEFGNPDTYDVTQPGLYSVGPFGARVSKQTKDVRAGDSFMVSYTGEVFAVNSGIDLTHNNVGTWIVRQPIILVHEYPAPADYSQYNQVEVNPIPGW